MNEGLHRIIRKGKKIGVPETLFEGLSKRLAESHSDGNSRDLEFLVSYYGLDGKAMTLERIGQTQENPITRERVRQIIDSAFKRLIEGDDESNPSGMAWMEFENALQDRRFIRMEELLKTAAFADFKKNVKGLIAFLNDCGIRQVAYRKKYYFYPDGSDRKEVVSLIQSENKVLRKSKTLEKMAKKAKTVTYVPSEVRQHLLEYAEKKKTNLNPLYENIISQYISERPYAAESYAFSRTKSWKARKGKAQWQQIGIYIDKNVFDTVKGAVDDVKVGLGKPVSLMSFICQAFIWHYDRHNGKTNG